MWSQKNSCRLELAKSNGINAPSTCTEKQPNVLLAVAFALSPLIPPAESSAVPNSTEAKDFILLLVFGVVLIRNSIDREH